MPSPTAFQGLKKEDMFQGLPPDALFGGLKKEDLFHGLLPEPDQESQKVRAVISRRPSARSFDQNSTVLAFLSTSASFTSSCTTSFHSASTSFISTRNVFLSTTTSFVSVQLCYHDSPDFESTEKDMTVSTWLASTSFILFSGLGLVVATPFSLAWCIGCTGLRLGLGYGFDYLTCDWSVGISSIMHSCAVAGGQTWLDFVISGCRYVPSWVGCLVSSAASRALADFLNGNELHVRNVTQTAGLAALTSSLHHHLVQSGIFSPTRRDSWLSDASFSVLVSTLAATPGVLFDCRCDPQLVFSCMTRTVFLERSFVHGILSNLANAAYHGAPRSSILYWVKPGLSAARATLLYSAGINGVEKFATNNLQGIGIGLDDLGIYRAKRGVASLVVGASVALIGVSADFSGSLEIVVQMSEAFLHAEAVGSQLRDAAVDSQVSADMYYAALKICESQLASVGIVYPLPDREDFDAEIRMQPVGATFTSPEQVVRDVMEPLLESASRYIDSHLILKVADFQGPRVPPVRLFKIEPRIKPDQVFQMKPVLKPDQVFQMKPVIKPAPVLPNVQPVGHFAKPVPVHPEIKPSPINPIDSESVGGFDQQYLDLHK
ncbi:hypothetical protein HDU98_012362 [Podochytrium sp. JEL0797]|nr:hypothetical protein HDU98_012362 [Podochytrium sp. JEL0797]